jgi:hypothetical protein
VLPLQRCLCRQSSQHHASGFVLTCCSSCLAACADASGGTVACRSCIIAAWPHCWLSCAAFSRHTLSNTFNKYVRASCYSEYSLGLISRFLRSNESSERRGGQLHINPCTWAFPRTSYCHVLHRTKHLTIFRCNVARCEGSSTRFRSSSSCCHDMDVQTMGDVPATQTAARGRLSACSRTRNHDCQEQGRTSSHTPAGPVRRR